MKHHLGDMSFLEFRGRMAADPVIIIPLGSVEIQGPSNPVGDYMLCAEIASRIGQRTDAIVAPTMPFGVAEVFRTVPGGMQISPEALRLVIKDLVGSFLGHGLERMVILNGHTGNHAPILEALRDVRRATDVVVPWFNIWPGVPRAVLDRAFRRPSGDLLGHGAEPIGSVYEYLFPHLRRADLSPPPEVEKTFIGLPTAGLASVKLDDAEIFVPIRMLDHCEAVVSGDPCAADAEAGRIIVEWIVETGCKLVEHLKTAPTRCP
jgi:creatinine amidohydrolase